MGNSDKIRWKQRFENFRRALGRLDEACSQSSYTNLELAGLVQRFMFTFELGWKVLKDLLFYEGNDLNTPREVIRHSFASNYLSESDCEIFLNALENRNLLSHIYEEKTAKEAELAIKGSYHPMLQRLNSFLLERDSQ